MGRISDVVRSSVAGIARSIKAMSTGNRTNVLKVKDLVTIEGDASGQPFVVLRLFKEKKPEDSQANLAAVSRQLKTRRLAELHPLDADTIQRLGVPDSTQGIQDHRASNAVRATSASEHAGDGGAAERLRGELGILRKERDSLVAGKDRMVAESQRLQAEQHKQVRQLGVAIETFWKEREDYYRGIHRGLRAEHGSNRKRLLGFRSASLRADVALMERLGCRLDLAEEAMALSSVPYDGGSHRWYGEGEAPVCDGTPATVYLPGWSIGEAHCKAALGAEESGNG